MTAFIARNLTPEKEQAKREQIAKEDALVEQADLEAYRQFGFDPDDPAQADMIRTIIRVRKHMTTYDVFGHKLLETGIFTESIFMLTTGMDDDRHPTDDEIVSCSTSKYIDTHYTITWQLDGGTDYVVHWSPVNAKEGFWSVKTPMRHGHDPYDIDTGDLYDDMDCVYGTIVGSYMCENKMFSWQKG